MLRRGLDARALLAPPGDHGSGVLSHRAAQAGLPPVCLPGGLQGCPGGGSAGFRPFLDLAALDVGDLR